ncbi:hypothetical protein BA768_09130 [Chryseobacterium sp. CBo1]|uniref:hypothetical protein n=1 Tax=Chryseobacterium sp. CBo1 TaxID=1869230 RepID=UPI0008105AB4|nr:hypothetical protein [Chryseobacterium sp. CBo1]OCK49517.1 hypothetical protein BA768_09130 [Chryseobacterium sp. CBo1]
MKIISKFVIGSDQGVSDFLSVKKQAFSYLHKNFIDKQQIDDYTEKQFDERKVITQLNDLSNQLIITYKEDLSIAYCLLKSGSNNSAVSENKRTTEIDFVILEDHDSEEVRNSLYNKFMTASKFTDIVWINILQQNTLNDFLKNKGFIRIENSLSQEFGLPSYILSLDIKALH